jgi:hypothetical protein
VIEAGEGPVFAENRSFPMLFSTAAGCFWPKSCQHGKLHEKNGGKLCGICGKQRLPFSGICGII